LVGLRPGAGEQTHHSTAELKLLVQESREAGAIQATLQDVVMRVLDIGDRRVGAIMTPRVDIDWIDIGEDPDTILRAIRGSRHEQLIVGEGSLDESLGIVLKKDLLDQALDGRPLNPKEVVQQPLVIYESTPIVRVIEEFKRTPVRLAMVVDEYGTIQGVVTQTDVLEAIAGSLPHEGDEAPAMMLREDGSWLVQGWASVHEVLIRLGLAAPPATAGYSTIAGFVLERLGRLPRIGETFEHGDWRFEVVDMDGPRIDALVVGKAHPKE
jgi:putative hemolysin